jgi:hypothetical protein
MNFRHLALFFLLLLPAANGIASSSDDTLRYYVSRSSLVIVGTIVGNVFGQSSSGIGPGPRVAFSNIPVHIRVKEVLCGSPLKKPLILVDLHRLDLEEGPIVPAPLGLGQPQPGVKAESISYRELRAGQGYVFFLVPHSKESRVGIGDEWAEWETADDWFGFMPVDAAMVYKLRKMR